MNGFYSYRTPHPASVSLEWRANGRLVSDFAEIAENVFLLPKKQSETDLSLLVRASLYHPIDEIVGRGARVTWCLTWYSDGRLGGTYLRGLVASAELHKVPSTQPLSGVIPISEVGRTVTVQVTLVLSRPGIQAMDPSVPREEGTILFRQSRTLSLSGAVPELSVEAVDFRNVEGLPSEIPYFVDLQWMPTDPDEQLEPGAIQVLVNTNHRFAATMKSGSEASALATSLLGTAVLEGLLSSMRDNRLLGNTWPEATPIPGSIGSVWKAALSAIVPDGQMGELRNLQSHRRNEYQARLLSAGWNAEGLL